MNFYKFFKNFTENPLLTGHNLHQLNSDWATNLNVDQVYMVRQKYQYNDPVFVFVAVNHNSDVMKRYFCVKYQTAVDRWNLFALE